MAVAALLRRVAAVAGAHSAPKGSTPYSDAHQSHCSCRLAGGRRGAERAQPEPDRSFASSAIAEERRDALSRGLARPRRSRCPEKHGRFGEARETRKREACCVEARDTVGTSARGTFERWVRRTEVIGEKERETGKT